MTTIVNKYIGITHPLDDMVEVKEFCESWKASNCSQGIHAFDEVHSLEVHCLHCDMCGMEVHISKIVLPDGKDEVVGDNDQPDSPETFKGNI
jgi:hypothetical protein